MQSTRTRSHSALRILHTFAGVYGFDPRRTVRALIGTPRYVRALLAFVMESRRHGRRLDIGALLPVVGESRHDGSGIGHYFHADLWAARCVLERRPAFHVDVGSRLDGFVAHLLASGQLVTHVDWRPLGHRIAGLTTLCADGARLSETLPAGSVSSLSSLHAAEHFGLGRYGDPIDPGACDAAMREMARVLAPGGRLYFAVPVGRERVEFNAHRVLDPVHVATSFPGLELRAFAAVDDAGVLVTSAAPADFRGADYACGLYEFERHV
jgi:SAM-dependent methyltransferase